MRKMLRITMLLLAAFWLTACSKEEPKIVNTDPVAFHSGDECHVCGMIIVEWPGPKGQAINKQNGETFKFCSTVDLFSWWLQPENRTLQAQIYVHDMAQTPWDQPEDEHLIDAREAWYVVGSDLQGAMGPSLASYSDKDAAEALTEQHGGRVLGFEQIDLTVLQEIAQAGHAQAAAHGEHMQQMMHGEETEHQPDNVHH